MAGLTPNKLHLLSRLLMTSVSFAVDTSLVCVQTTISTYSETNEWHVYVWHSSVRRVVNFDCHPCLKILMICHEFMCTSSMFWQVMIILIVVKVDTIMSWFSIMNYLWLIHSYATLSKICTLWIQCVYYKPILLCVQG